ncbi:sensor histidine kinase [Amycolatopsis anabasis]|uniref:sensor histidine kinase n=1 Tax=Amycolatopsis anabasis TaxID=1840409 RepID=UPI00131D7EB1|nr:histidine kinase [Amycolatopsis anabasis]
MRRFPEFVRGLVATAQRSAAEFLRAVADDLRGLTPGVVARQASLVVAVIAGEVAVGLVRTGGRPDLPDAVPIVVIAALVVLRSSVPRAALCAAVFLLILCPPQLGAVAAAVCAWSAGRHPGGRWRIVAAVVVCALLWVVSLPPSLVLTAPDRAAGELAGFAVVVLLPLVSGRYAEQRRRLATASARVEAQLRRERSLMVRQARLRERGRIARDMHDGLGHQLSLLSVLTGALQVEADLPASARTMVHSLHRTALAAVVDLAAMVGALAPEAAGNDELGPHTVDALPQLVEGSRVAGSRVDFRRNGVPRELPAAVSRAAYRLVQEGLTNAHKHATGAPIAVSVNYEPDALLVEVRNDPPAPDARPAPPGTRLGLIGLNERVRLAGGILHAEPTPDGGFRVAAILPYALGDVGEPST